MDFEHTKEEQSEKPIVSIIMNCLNGEMYLRAAIDSVYAQTFQNWEIIFWDNASVDDSATIAQSYQDGRVRYFRGQNTVPLGCARNLAIEKSRGEYIAFLDCDDLWLPEKLERQLPLFVADEEVGLVYSDTYFFNENGEYKRLYEKRKPYKGYRFEDLLNNYLISLETAVIRRSALYSLDHWFDESFSYIEEYDLFVRIGIAWKIDYYPNVLAKWRVHSKSLSWRAPDTFIYESLAMIDKLREDEKLLIEHAGPLDIAKKRIHLKQAVMEWKNGNSAVAREIIRNNLELRWMSFFVYIGSYASYKLVEGIYRFLTGAVIPVKS